MNKQIFNQVNVLYVEDEESVRDFTGKTIQSIVKSITLAANGQEGLDRFSEVYDTQEAFDLIITDINMPKMGGLEMCEKIKEIDKEIPIIITSAHNDAAFLKKAIDLGVNSYTLKPIDLYQLIGEMIKTLEPIMLKKQLIVENKELMLKNKNLSSDNIKNKENIKALFDTQDSMVLMMDGDELEYCNNKFLDFFGICSVETFVEENGSISTFIGLNDDFNHCEENKNLHWVEYLEKIPQNDRVIQLTSINNIVQNFQVFINEYQLNTKHYVVSFSDITALREKSKFYEYQDSHDLVTDLYNENKFEVFFNKELRRSRRYKHDLSLLLISIDNIGNYDADENEEVGNTLFKNIASLIKKTVREQDIVSRLDNSDFAILIPETSLESSKVVAKKLQLSIKELHMPDISTSVCVSCGISSYNKDEGTKTITQRANSALESSKSSGGNCINTKE